MQDLARQACGIARQAGAAIMNIYNGGQLDVEFKEDNSPLTKADQAANDIITAGLHQISSHAIISEENNVRSSKSSTYWLVDPLDGTKEFIKRNGEFTVNIALVESGVPILGVVYAPVADIMYWGVRYIGAFKEEASYPSQRITSVYKRKIPTVVASRSHRNAELEKFIADIGEHEEITMGSSLKLCLVAEGRVSIYPRFTPTYVWDTAAAHAIVSAAGGHVKEVSGNELTYSLQGNLKNPFFIAAAN